MRLLKQNFLGIFFGLICLSSFAQTDCSIEIVGPPVICSPREISLEATGELFEVQWFDSLGSKLDTGAFLNLMVDKSTNFIAVNRQNIGDELIVNGDFESGNTGFESDYFESCVEGSMPQGGYCITETSNQFHPGWSGCSDHTSGSGKMLVSDGANVSNQKIWCQTVAVEQNQTYAFSTQVTSLINVAPPIMQFSINGELLGAPFKAPKETCAWNEFFQTWDSNEDVSAEICVVNQNTAGQGNDFALDDLSFRTVCVDSAFHEVSLIDNIDVDLGADSVVCDGDDVLVGDNRFENNPGYSSEWSDGPSGAMRIVNSIGTYAMTVEDQFGCTGSDTITLTGIDDPISSLNADTTVCFDVIDSLVLYAGEANKVVWYDAARNTKQGKYFSVTEPGEYTVELINGDNCFVTDKIRVDTLCSRFIFFPNAFTPNGDGLNDVFQAYSVDTYGYELVIFNNWGQVVFETNDLNEGWDGTMNGQKSVLGVYVYRCTYTLVDDVSGDLVEKTKVGHLTLIR